MRRNRESIPITKLVDENGYQIIEVNSQISDDCFRDYNNYYFSRRGEVVDEVRKSGVYEGYRGDEVFGAHQYILETGWCVIVELNKDKFFGAGI